MHKHNRSLICWVSLLILASGFLAGLLCLSTPKPYSGKDPTVFSAVSASRWIQEISKAPHSVFDEKAHDDVQKYLVSELKGLGLEVTTANHVLNEPALPSGKLNITNIHAKMDGKSNDAILLVTHYDSAFNWDQVNWKPLPGVSYGAADAGYGIGVILETLRAIRAKNIPLENDIQILITDAEELGMVGAAEALKTDMNAYKNVKLVINVEARGIKGPAVMFETGKKNERLIDFYVKHARDALSYSFATAVYRVMPNGTDFTEFLDRGFTGLNFAVLDNLDYYHTADDNYQNISLGSIQHYGNQISSMVAQFVETPTGQLPEFKGSDDKIFFNILPGILISYSNGTTPFLLGLATLLLIVAMMINRRRNSLNISRFLLSFGGLLGSLVTAALLGTLAAYLAALLNKKSFNIIYLPRIPMSGLILAVTLILLALFQFFLVQRLTKKNPTGLETILGASLINILLGLATYLFLPGASFLFILPALLALVYVLVCTVWKSPLARIPAFALAVFPIPAIFIPLVYLFYLALTLGATGIVALFVLIGLMTLSPVVLHHFRHVQSDEVT